MEDASLATGWAEVERLVASLRAQHGDRVLLTRSEPRDRGYRMSSERHARKLVLTLPVGREHASLVLIVLAIPMAAAASCWSAATMSNTC